MVLTADLPLPLSMKELLICEHYNLAQVNALTKAILPVCSACLIIFLVMSIYGILGVSYFGASQPAYFGDWGRAMMTLFAAGTLENWVRGSPLACRAASFSNSSLPPLPHHAPVTFFDRCPGGLRDRCDGRRPG